MLIAWSRRGHDYWGLKLQLASPEASGKIIRSKTRQQSKVGGPFHDSTGFCMLYSLYETREDLNITAGICNLQGSAKRDTAHGTTSAYGSFNRPICPQCSSRKAPGERRKIPRRRHIKGRFPSVLPPILAPI